MRVVLVCVLVCMCVGLQEVMSGHLADLQSQLAAARALQQQMTTDYDSMLTYYGGINKAGTSGKAGDTHTHTHTHT